MDLANNIIDIDDNNLAFSNVNMKDYTIYRCDPFVKNHDGLHILFIGDSVTAGEAVNLNEHWTSKTYSKISETRKCSGLFNIAVPGSSITDSIDQFYKYVGLYGNPDVVFFLMTQPYRDLKYIQNEKAITKFSADFTTHYMKRLYKYFEQYCLSNNIILNSFTWDVSMQNKKVALEDKMRRIARGVFFKRNEFSDCNDIFSNFKTFNSYTLEQLMEHLYASKLELQAKDGVHPGPAFHEFYTEFIYNKYLEDINDNSRS
jgi:hypothetical protein